MKKIYWAFIIAFLLVISCDVWGQVAAPPIDLTPFERPAYLTLISIQNKDSEKMLEIIADSVKKYGYSDVHIDLKEQKIEANKYDVKDSRNFCKILLWFERDFQQPDKIIKVFLYCGRFEYMMAKTTGIFRVKLSESMEDQYFRKLRNSIESTSTIK
jgi:hypothetical protein